MRVFQRTLQLVSVCALIALVTASAQAAAPLSAKSGPQRSTSRAPVGAVEFSSADAEAQQQGIVGYLEVPIDGSMVNTLMGDSMEAGAPAQAALWPILIPGGLLYLVWCVGQCQCCENYYGNGGTPQNEPSCCGNCFSPRCFDFSSR